MNRLAIAGASGHGLVAADIAEACGWKQIEFFDDCFPGRMDHHGWPISGTIPQLLERKAEFDGVFVAIGNNRIRARVLGLFSGQGSNVVTLIHPSAVVSSRAHLGEGSVVMPLAVVNANASVGVGCILNTASTVDHDCQLGECVHISPGAHIAGAVYIGRNSWIGIGASVRQCIVIGNSVIVGAGAAVVQDIPDGITVVGIPAKPLST
ncbi:acetyltransferase [Pseudomonas sp. KNUC1026]|uniref:acetyltransferase n=1 Tax=Pseudomonas sp. KNUC1026 TaxID=2893890 RepID=UPI001F3194A4|nr:acetyltransferase [Pseudomonas sp. KNUC1026]UFH48245.1 acetyltransferase [Pseudomonas sp. KNUC1026]